MMQSNCCSSGHVKNGLVAGKSFTICVNRLFVGLFGCLAVGIKNILCLARGGYITKCPGFETQKTFLVVCRVQVNFHESSSSK